MNIPAIEVWVLTFFVAHGGPDRGEMFLGGEYQTRPRCIMGAFMQLPHWQLLHGGNRVTWLCELRRM